MSLQRPMFEQTYKIGKFICKMSWGDGEYNCEWDPDKPDSEYFKSLGHFKSNKFWRKYTAARRKFMQSVVDLTGVPVAVVDIGPTGELKTSTFIPSSSSKVS